MPCWKRMPHAIDHRRITKWILQPGWFHCTDPVLPNLLLPRRLLLANSMHTWVCVQECDSAGGVHVRLVLR